RAARDASGHAFVPRPSPERGVTTALPVGPGYRGVIDVAGLDAAIGVLAADGYRVVGPTVREGAVVYDEISSVADLPAGWTDEQDGGTYRLHRREDGALFGYAVGPPSWNRYLFPPRTLLWRALRNAGGFAVGGGEGDEDPR